MSLRDNASVLAVHKTSLNTLHGGVRKMGTALSIGGLIFVLHFLIGSDWHAGISQFGHRSVCLSAFIYFAGRSAITWAWILASSSYVRTTAQTKHIAFIYARANMAKYLPGSIFQYVARQTDMRQAGSKHIKTAKVSLDEIIDTSSSAGLIAGACLLATGSFTSLPIHGAMLNLAGPVICCVTVGCLCLLLFRPSLAGPVWRTRGLRVVYQLCFEVSGLLLLASVTDAETALTSAGLFSVAWLAGFVVIGAPSGLGVREFIIVVAIDTSVGSAMAATLAMTLRIVTVTADTLFWLLTARMTSDR